MTTQGSTGGEFRPLNVVATHDSPVLQRNRTWLQAPENRAIIDKQIAAGFTPDAQFDMSFFGGPTIANATVAPFFVGGDGRQSGGASQWSQSDMDSVATALGQALGDANLETVMAQYFASEPVVAVGPSATVTNQSTSFQQSDVETMAQNEYAAGTLTGDLSSTLFCFMLSEGTELFASDGSNSHQGLGGYHGSVAVTDTSTNAPAQVYYAVGVYSETSGGVTNGIPAFDQPWKNVVATFYHEINEWRTDADVEQAQGNNVNGVLGWYSQQYGEIGDIPITEAGSNLSEVFIEAALADGSGTAPIQLMYSNFDHGPAQQTSAPVGSALRQGSGGTPS